MPEIKQDIRAATFIIAANDSVHKNMADYVCDGVNDHIEIQAALDALPAGGGEVKLLEGTYNVEATINLDSNQTLRGCGRNTILTTATAGLYFLSAVGGAGTEKIGIVVADLQIDGGTISDCGVRFEYVDYSLIQNVYSRRISKFSILLENSDFNTVTGNIFQGNGHYGIHLSSSNNNTITGNTFQGNGWHGINLSSSNNNTITGNTFQGNGWHGINLSSSNNNTITGNTLTENSQTTNNTYDDISLSASDYNNIQGNTCRAGALANKPRYGINISDSASGDNLVTNNDLYNDGFGTGSFNDAGTLTIVRDNNRGIAITQVRHYDYVKNTSGGALAAGDVVILKAVAAGNEITTTTTEGDQKVFGMAAGAIADNASGYVLVKGKTIVLKVDGTTDIAIGDLIGCFTTAKIGMKAASGKMAFAIALEAYTNNDSNGVIDALLITPRQAV